MATFVINHQKKVIKDFKRKHKKYDDVEKLPFWGQFIRKSHLLVIIALKNNYIILL